MSSRRSLYRANRSHTSLYGPRTDTAVTHWQLDYVTINTTRDEEASTDAPQKTNSFQVKTWVQVPGDAYKAADDGVEDDTLPFIKHSHLEAELGGINSHEASEPPADSTPKPESNGLSSVLPDSSTQNTTSGGNTADITPSVTPAAETPLSTSEATDSERASASAEAPAEAPAESAPAEPSTEPVVATTSDEVAQSEPAANADAASAPTTEAAPTETPSVSPDAQPAASEPSEPTNTEAEPPTVSASDIAGTDVTGSDVPMPDAQ